MCPPDAGYEYYGLSDDDMDTMDMRSPYYLTRFDYPECEDTLSDNSVRHRFN